MESYERVPVRGNLIHAAPEFSGRVLQFALRADHFHPIDAIWVSNIG
jgi:hypothetical protein